MSHSNETETEKTVTHELAAAREVLLNEIAWFKTLDAETVELIADTAPLHTPEYEHATVELRRRACAHSAKAPAS
jgi:hypothetical protein